MCNPERLAENVLPRYFRHTQYSSWVRTLNHYSFRKTRRLSCSVGSGVY